MIKLKLKLNQM